MRTLTSKETATERAKRLAKAETRKVRKLCGWNAFQRSKMQGLQLSKAEYDRRIQDISKEWRGMSSEERQPFVLEAQIQQSKLDTAAETPLQTASERAAGVEAPEIGILWRNATKKISGRRLALNRDQFKAHELWSLPTQLGDSPLKAWFV